MVGIGKRPRTAVAPRRLYVALGAQAVIAAAAAASRLATGTEPGTGTGTRLTGYVDVALISLFIAAYGAATLLLAHTWLPLVIAIASPLRCTWPGRACWPRLWRTCSRTGSRSTGWPRCGSCSFR
jgi:hypothetical protein